MSILNKETVWITGAGVNVPHGTSVTEVAEGVLGGRSTVGLVDHFDASNHPCQIGARLRTFPRPPGWEGSRPTRSPRSRRTMRPITTALDFPS